MRAEELVPLLERVNRSGKGWTARCPAHEDRIPSLSFWDSDDDWVRFKCHAGCSREAILAALGLSLEDIGPDRDAHPLLPRNAATREGLTLEAYAAAKGLPPDFLRTLGVTQVTYMGAPAVRIPYVDREGKEQLVKFRIALDGDEKFRWKKGSKLCLYGLPWLRVAREAGYVVLSEGESCTQTLWLAGLPALGLPGAGNWDEDRDAAHLDDIAMVYVVVEPDKGGQAVLAWLAESRIRERVKLINLNDAGDVSELYLQDRARFAARFAQELERAIPWEEHAGDGQPRAPHMVAGDARQVPAPNDPMGVARKFVDEHYADVRSRLLIHHRGQFFAWTGTHWPKQEDRAVRAKLYRWLDGAVYVEVDTDGNAETVPWHPTKAKIGNVLEALQAVTHEDEHLEPPFWIEGEAPWSDGHKVVAMANGLLDLSTRVLHPHTPAYFNEFSLPFAYDPKAPKPVRWHKFTHQLWPDDQQSIDTLQEIFGYLISGDTAQQKAFLFVGPRRSGKGTIGRVQRGLLGAENAVSPTIASLGGDFGLQPLLGKPLAMITDARISDPRSGRVAVERILSISGEDAATVDRKFRESWTGKLPTRFEVLTNELPRFDDASGVIASRFVILTLTTSFFGRENPKLTEELLEEAPGIFNWSLDGLDRLNDRGRFVQPKSAQGALQQLEDLASPVGAFVRDCCVVAPDGFVGKDELWEAWKQWIADEGGHHGTKSVLIRNLRAVLPTVKPGKLNEPGVPDGKDGTKDERKRILKGVALDPKHRPGTTLSVPSVPSAGAGGQGDGQADGQGYGQDDLAQPSPADNTDRVLPTQKSAGASADRVGPPADRVDASADRVDAAERLVHCPICGVPKTVDKERAGITYLVCGHSAVLQPDQDEIEELTELGQLPLGELLKRYGDAPEDRDAS